MIYKKLSLTFQEQVRSLKDKGLIVNDESFAKKKLSSLSYYRLRAYTYPFQDNEDSSHPFIRRVDFESIIQLYEFDKALRHLVFQKLERIEISLRTQIIYHYSQKYGSHWPQKDTLFFDAEKYEKLSNSIKIEVDRSKEEFIKHYKLTYNQPKQPPSWMSLEVVSMGTLSMLLSGLKHTQEKKQIANHFGLVNVYQLQNWAFCFSQARNVCAHHGRLWNRRLSQIQLPYNLPNNFLTKQETKKIYNNKVYALLCAMQYMLNRVEDEHTLAQELKALMLTLPFEQEREMGFPENWRTHSLWN